MKVPFFNKTKKPFKFNRENCYLKFHKNWLVWIKRDNNSKFIEMYGRNFK